MPQEFHVVQCLACATYQVDIVKNSPKWKCKMCGKSQPLETVYLKASAKVCRETVQSLNMRRGAAQVSATEDIKPQSGFQT